MADYADDFADGGTLTGGLLRADGSYLRTLSASAISTLLTCPERFRLSYLLQRWPKASAATTLGHAYHYALQKNFEQKIWSREDWPVERVLRAYEQGWGQALDVDEGIQWRNDDPGATKTLGAEMVKLYHQRLSPTVQPIAVEEHFEREIPGVPLKLVGRVDLLAEDELIIDRKTDKSGATKARPEWRVQALVYMAAFPQHSFAWHVQAKSGTLRTYGPEKHPGLLLRNTPGKQRSAHLLVKEAWQMLADFYARYGLDQPWPGVALAHPYACSTCGHRSACVWQV